MPFIGPDSDAFFMAAWIESLVIGFSVSSVRSTSETSIVGTRTAWPSNFPLSSGMTSESALAAPVELGTMLMAAARAPQIALPVRDVEDRLVVRVRVDRRHETAPD